MKTTALRLYGKNDLRLETFELPAIREDEILFKVLSDSICMSTYKAVIQGTAHKRIPADVDKNPTMMGHEFCGEIVEVGAKWKGKYAAGDTYSIQPAHNKGGTLYAPGYSYRYCGGDATYCILTPELMEMDCLLPYAADAYFYGSLAEPMSCVIRAYHAVYHTEMGSYKMEAGIKKGGNMAILAGVGPMGLGAIDYALHNPGKRPGLLVVTDISEERLARARELFTVEDAKQNGVNLHYLNTANIDAVAELMKLTDKGYDDVFVFAPVKPVIEQGDAILAKDGCLNFFSGPADPSFTAEVNFYNVHYNYTHIMGTVGGNSDDMREALQMMSAGTLTPSAMVTHIGGLSSAAETTQNLPNIPGGKKLVYTHIALPLTAIADFHEKGKADPLFKKLHEIVSKNRMLWNAEAEHYLLANAPKFGESKLT
ncbi:MAG TPA: L-sorbose 1-phosphate reductase [Clostridiales bacterium]|nr:L-sorbose 1-phosphate reductase [Clostridiales bacterium]